MWARYLLPYIQLQLALMKVWMAKTTKKYSKISLALKHYFLTCLYYHCLDIKQACDRCRINFSTAKVILKELSKQEKRFIKRLVRQKEKDEREGMDVQETCSYASFDQQPILPQTITTTQIQIISRLGHDFFALASQKQ